MRESSKSLANVVKKPEIFCERRDGPLRGRAIPVQIQLVQVQLGAPR
jgi:hypothetical protein